MTWDDKFDLQFYGMICEYVICIPFIFKFINRKLYKDIKWKIFWLEYVDKIGMSVWDGESIWNNTYWITLWIFIGILK